MEPLQGGSGKPWPKAEQFWVSRSWFCSKQKSLQTTNSQNSPGRGRAGSVLAWPTEPARAPRGTEQTPHHHSLLLHHSSTSAFTGNVEKAVLLWPWKPVCPLGSCSCALREDPGRAVPPLLTLFISDPSEISSRTVQGCLQPARKAKPPDRSYSPISHRGYCKLELRKSSWLWL